MPPYRVAIIGLGRMAHTIDAEVVDYPAVTLPYSIAASVRAMPELELAAGCDLLPDRRECFGERWGVRALYADYRQMLAREQPDMVAVCTRGESHAELGVAVAEAGVPMLYLEKAMACSLREADAVRDAVSRRGTAFNTGVLRRFNPRYEQARRLIAAGAIGEVRAAVHYASTNLLHGHIHSVDTLLFLLGDPRVESVQGCLLPPAPDCSAGRLEQDPRAVYRLELAGGVEAATVPAGNWEFEVLGTEGAVRGENNGTDWRLRKREPVGDRRAAVRAVPWPEPEAPRESPTVRCLRDLVRAHETRAPTLGAVETAHHATEICFAVAESHRRGGARVVLPLEERDFYIFHV